MSAEKREDSDEGLELAVVPHLQSLIQTDATLLDNINTDPRVLESKRRFFRAFSTAMGNEDFYQGIKDLFSDPSLIDVYRKQVKITGYLTMSPHRFNNLIRANFVLPDGLSTTLNLRDEIFRDPYLQNFRAIFKLDASDALTRTSGENLFHQFLIMWSSNGGDISQEFILLLAKNICLIHRIDTVRATELSEVFQLVYQGGINEEYIMGKLVNFFER